jgi:UV DNA damage repair endonuclease
MTWKRFNQLCDQYGKDEALSQLGDRWLNNIKVTIECIKHCSKNGWGYRISSSLFPCLTHPEFDYTVSDVPQYGEIMSIFQEQRPALAWVPKRDEEEDVEDDTFSYGVRLSTHPDQFNVLASLNEEAVRKTIIELNHHGWLMDQLGCQRNHFNPINIHVNCTDGNLISKRFMTNLRKCTPSVVKRLVLENEDKGCWNVQNLITYFNKPYGIPVTFDNLHHKCNPSPLLISKNGDDYAMEACAETWGCRPLFHYSESHPDKSNLRSHADMPTRYPNAWNEYDWDVELKSKDAAIRALAQLQIKDNMGKSKVISETARWKKILSNQGIANDHWE